MTITFNEAQADLPRFWDKVIRDREIIILQRQGAEDVALIAADELQGLLETAHLLHSPRNAERLLSALQRARNGEGKAQTVTELRQEFGLQSE